MRKEEKYKILVDYFEKEMPDVKPELHYENAFQLLVAVILSAQCTDRRVNMVTPELFRRFPSAVEMALASPEELYEYIKSISYPNSKADHLSKMASRLVSDFGGEVPDTLEQLVQLPGVGRKTANVVLAVIWEKSAMAVDTHIFRVSHRLGLVSDKCTTPLSVEKELMRYFPKDKIPDAHHWLLLHGRYVCQSRTPKCEKCGIRKLCSYVKKKNPSV